MKMAIILLAGILLAQPALASAQQTTISFLEQDVTLSALTSVTVDAGAHTAHISGTGTASFDNGQTALSGGAVPIDITIANTADASYQGCQDALANGLPPHASASISGNGFYHVEMQNNAITKASVTIQQLKGCAVQ